MSGYAALGVEGVSKARNAGAVIRTAHAFGASFAFTVGETLNRREIAHADTSKAIEQIPLYMFNSAKEGVNKASIDISPIKSTSLANTS